MWNIYNLIDKIKERPLMYIWDKKLTSLSIYIAGYQWCLAEKEIKEEEMSNLNMFHDWIANEYGYSESTSWWLSMILENSKNEEDALNKFFILMEKFQNKKGKS